MNTRKKIQALRSRMRKAGVYAYLIPGTDPHQSEYVPACWERRQWASGFTGSAGELLVTLKGAGLWTDGRYFLQAEEQLADSGIELFRAGMPGVPTLEQYVKTSLGKRRKLGIDAKTVSAHRYQALDKAAKGSGGELVSLDGNLVDSVWADQPDLPAAPIKGLATKFAGESVASKLQRLRAAMAERGANAHIISMLDAIAWLFNIRGTDVDFNPVTISYAIVTEDSATLFIDPRKVSNALVKRIEKNVTLAPYEDFQRALNRLGKRKGTVWLDGTTASAWIHQQLGKAECILDASPIGVMKARKNDVELAGMRAAHERDGVAVARFLAWLDANVAEGGLSEMSAAEQLRGYRAEGKYFQGLSFPTISGYGPHGAIIHYSVTEDSNIALKPRGLYLVDSGAQYLDGTTDITRTVALGPLTRAEKDAYTRVLKGHIALATARFPAGSTGARLDSFARQHLWQAGLDYNHGTGHGVGAYLNVHEGPQSISHRPQQIPLEVGNIQSNEPGYYKPGAFGIRIENLVEVVPSSAAGEAGREFLELATLTVCPIDTRPINPKLLTDDERAWLNRYHRRVKKTLSPALDKTTKRWLSNACRPI